MSGIAIPKPDHLGDLVLASPAILAICRHYGQVTLFVGSGSRALAQFLLARPSTFDVSTSSIWRAVRHPPINPKQIARDLNQFDFVFCLRDDPVVRELLDSARVPSPFAAGDDLTHETARQKRAVVEVIGPYSRTGLFAELPIHWPTASQNLGLCVAAGFPTNKWPNACWLDLASRLGRQGLFVTLIGGPGERDDLRLLSRLLPHVPHTVVQGGDDLGEFLDALDGVDLIVGSDGGTVHICSLRKPICSISDPAPGDAMRHSDTTTFS